MKNKLTIIMPVYNERDTIEQVLTEWKNTLKIFKINYHLILCEDGSNDGTKKLLPKIRKKYNFKLIADRKRIGYGEAILRGIIASKTEYILFVDSDGQFDPKDLIKLWNRRSKADVVKGWRVKRVDPLNRKLYSSMFYLFFQTLFGNRVKDPSIGYVLFERKKIAPLTAQLRFMKEGFGWNFTAACIKNGLRIIEIPVKNRLRIKGKTNVYKLEKIPAIAVSNLLGLVQLRLTR